MQHPHNLWILNTQLIAVYNFRFYYVFAVVVARRGMLMSSNPSKKVRSTNQVLILTVAILLKIWLSLDQRIPIPTMANLPIISPSGETTILAELLICIKMSRPLLIIPRSINPSTRLIRMFKNQNCQAANCCSSLIMDCHNLFSKLSLNVTF